MPSGLTRIDEIILQTYDQLQKLSGEDRRSTWACPPALRRWTRIITGLNRIGPDSGGGAPRHGKDRLCAEHRRQCGHKTGKKVAVFSLEMSKEQLVTRLLSTEARSSRGAYAPGNSPRTTG